MTSQKTKDLQKAQDPSATALTAMELPDGMLQPGHYRIDAMDIEAQGIARKPDGKVVFIEGALPFQILHPAGLELHAEILLNTRATVIRIDQANPLIGLR